MLWSFPTTTAFASPVDTNPNLQVWNVQPFPSCPYSLKPVLHTLPSYFKTMLCWPPRDWNLDQVVDFRSNIYMKPKFKFSKFGEISRKIGEISRENDKNPSIFRKILEISRENDVWFLWDFKMKNYFFTQISSCHQNFIDRSPSTQHYDFSYLEWSDRYQNWRFWVSCRFASDLI